MHNTHCYALCVVLTNLLLFQNISLQQYMCHFMFVQFKFIFFFLILALCARIATRNKIAKTWVYSAGRIQSCLGFTNMSSLCFTFHPNLILIFCLGLQTRNKIAMTWVYSAGRIQSCLVCSI